MMDLLLVAPAWMWVAWANQRLLSEGWQLLQSVPKQAVGCCRHLRTSLNST